MLQNSFSNILTVSFVKVFLLNAFKYICIKHLVKFVASSGIEPESGASEALILSIVLRGHICQVPKWLILPPIYYPRPNGISRAGIILRGADALLSKMADITAEYFYRYGQQYYAEKFSYYRHTIGTHKIFYPF